MITDELKYRIREAFGHVPTAEQEQAIETFALFMTDRLEHAVMVLRGSAGTGKTKVFSLYADHAAYTIHRRIYRQKSLEGGFDLNYNSAHDTLFIVDEASMISRDGLLDDLIRFVYNERNCRLLLIGGCQRC